MPVDLRLNAPRNTADTSLRFGADGGPIPPPDPTPRAGLVAGFGLPWHQGSAAIAPVRSPWTAAGPAAATAALPWDRPSPRQAESAPGWTGLTPLPGGALLIWEGLEDRASGTAAPWAYPPPRRQEDRAPWADAAPLSFLLRGLYRHPPRKGAADRLPWADGRPLEDLRQLGYHSRPARRRHERRLPWADGIPAVSLWPRPDPWIPPPPPPRVITPDLVLRCLRALSGAEGTHLPFGRLCLLLPEGGQTIPVRRVYIVIHDIELIRVADNFPIQASRLSLSLDADAWAWQVSAALLGKEALDAILPAANGEPVTLEARIDGHAWQFRAEEWSEDRRFGQRAINIQGRGLSAGLGAPYELPGAGVSASAMTAQQLMAAHLPIGEGWSLDWQATDWLVPAGAWSWQDKSPIQAIHEMAQAVGYVVRPAPAAKTLRIQPRYPVLPWTFATATPALVIPDAAILNLSRQQPIVTQANAVFVHGGETGGVLARVRRTGSAGDRLAPTASHSLITHADAARALGSRLLAGQEQQPEVRSLTLPAGGPDFPLAEIGQLIRLEIANTTVHGLVNAVNIEASRADGGISVRQTLTLGEDTPNQWTRFRRLLPESPLLAGRVDVAHADGTATVELWDGGLIRVRGAAAVGQRVYVRGGQIEGEAPSLGQVEIEV